MEYDYSEGYWDGGGEPEPAPTDIGLVCDELEGGIAEYLFHRGVLLEHGWKFNQ